MAENTRKTLLDLQMQATSIWAMDFFTVDTMFNKRYYVLFIINHSSREIVRFAITENPVREFVRQQLIEFEHGIKRAGYMLHDNATQFKLRYVDYGLRGIAISVGAHLYSTRVNSD
jgi:transposase InsO family protein